MTNSQQDHLRRIENTVSNIDQNVANMSGGSPVGKTVGAPIFAQATTTSSTPIPGGANQCSWKITSLSATIDIEVAVGATTAILTPANQRNTDLLPAGNIYEAPPGYEQAAVSVITAAGTADYHYSIVTTS